MLGVVQILAGLSLFLFGMQMLSSGIEKLAGAKIQQWLERVASNHLHSAGIGALATALVQSSGLIMVTMIGLINANLMSVEQSIAVMLGQEIGTTMTAQVVAFDIGNFRLLLLIVGFIFLEFFPRRDWKKFGELLMGLGIVFVGMGTMSNALDNLVAIPWVSNMLLHLDTNIGWGILGGTLLTGVVQSSTAVTSLTVAMGISNVITLPGAISVILGANIGSCVTGLIASVRLSSTARQASLAQIIINTTGVLLFIPFIMPFAALMEKTSSVLPRQIANSHTAFNLIVSILLFPFIRQIARLVKRIVPERDEKDEDKKTIYIDENQHAVPSVAISEANRELHRMGELSAEMMALSCQSLIEQDEEKAEKVLEMEEALIDPIAHELDHFINTLMFADLSHQQQRRCFQVKTLLIDIERVGDMAEDIAQFAQERVLGEISFSDEAINELTFLWKFAHNTYSDALTALSESDKELAKKVCQSESEFDKLYSLARERHVKRLEEGTCSPSANIIFTETLRNLERISDHADNIGISVQRN